MLWYLVTAVISASAGVFCMGMWCSASIQRMRGQRDIATSAYDAAYTNYATERRKRLEAEQARDEIDIACKHWMSENTQLHARLKEAEQAHTDLADKHNILLAKAYIRDGARFVRVVK